MALEMVIKGQGTFRFPDTMTPKDAEKLIRRDFPDMFDNAAPLPSFVELEQTELKRHEGVVLNSDGLHKSYRDNKGNPTGGYGHLLSDAETEKYPQGTEIPDSVVNTWFSKDSAIAEKALEKVMLENGIQELPDEAKQVLYNMTFNLGETGIREFDDMWNAYSRDDFEGAARAMKESVWFEEVKSRGTDLVSRVGALADVTANLPGTKFVNQKNGKKKEDNNVED